MSRIPCEVVRDLFPSYIDGLTSETSNKEISEHLQECEECRKILASMKGEEEAFVPEETDKKEIDYLKKNRRRTFMIVLFSILGVLSLAILLIALRFFVIGDKGRENGFAWTCEVSGRTVTLRAKTAQESATSVGAVRYEEKDGVIIVTARSTLASFLHKGGYEGTYTASSDIRQVRLGDRILWDEGSRITYAVSNLWASRHAYVGDMPANNRSALALNIYDVFGPYTNELETKEAPYGWKILLRYDPAEDPDITNEESMRKAAYLLIAAIGNLDRVTFSYPVHEAPMKDFTVTREEADAFFGQSVRTCMDSPKILEDLYQKTGWAHVVIARRARAVMPPWFGVEETIAP